MSETQRPSSGDAGPELGKTTSGLVPCPSKQKLPNFQAGCEAVPPDRQALCTLIEKYSVCAGVES